MTSKELIQKKKDYLYSYKPNFGNMEYVCKECHDLFEGHGLGNDKVKPLFVFDAEGQPVSMREIDRGGKK